ncbi:metal-sensitive transcriptional regulator [Erythrobacter sp. SD-21]|uniref:metal-sensitive transcriptional regulator n=1 Tax=Erythrobacter sp. SD-21 TaxID=161528 RepID=UPI000153FB3E|nr:metal-sensitive transcriptional regulator [Erythrobacter sp. SD-21]EDL49136.1 hypothetical protein ED21_20689 [Erythrobacter sp. SD-21]
MSEGNEDKIRRLNRVAGQVNGIARMIEEERYCIDILHQIQAVRSALAKVESQVLKDHAASCIAEAISSGDAGEQERKFGELMELFEKRK